MERKFIKIAYIGGGSRQWARNLMSDLSIEKQLNGEVRLYDIDIEAAYDNAKIGALYQKNPQSVSSWNYIVKEKIEDALIGADFVIISIMPATFKEMSVYLHHPEKYHIYQSVGDTTGPAGVMRSLIAMPIFVEFGKAIKKYAPNAWVINFTNPMTICLRALHEGFPEIKAYGNCHEVFGTQEDLAEIFNKIKGVNIASREDVKVTVSGINHFTWITKASCFGEDLMPLYGKQVEQYGNIDGESDKEDFMKHYPFGSESKVKYDLFKRYHCMAAAGDRHLAEFMPSSFYLKDLNQVAKFKFHLTPSQWRIDRLKEYQLLTKQLIAGKKELTVKPSGEEGIRQIKALLGMETLITNINHINIGQAIGLPFGQVVETNALFRFDAVEPIIADKLPLEVENMVKTHMKGHELLIKSYRTKDLKYAYEAMENDPLCKSLSEKLVSQMFFEMVDQIKSYLTYYTI
ncbi:MAG: alpha-glucosidase/alpha-galactosidase [Acholeplasmataceae bacterium]|nr:alpha-glucosidase/alpha-galactosidase [Acholeplasmataceae bacterium]